jgi:hypothetical protein
MTGSNSRRTAFGIAAVSLAATVARAANPITDDPITGQPTTQPSHRTTVTAHNPITGSTVVEHGATTDRATVENPLAAGWAKFKVGSTATYAMDMTAPGGPNIKGTATLTLKSVAATAVTLDSAAVIGGQTVPSTATFPATVDADAAKHTGTADVVAMGKTFKCEVYELEQAAFGPAGGGSTMTVYISADVPGGMVKAVAHPKSGQENGTLTLTATDAK